MSDKVDIISFYGNPPKKSSRRAIFSADGQTFPRVRAAAECVALGGRLAGRGLLQGCAISIR